MDDLVDDRVRDRRTWGFASASIDDLLDARYGSTERTVARMHDLTCAMCREGRVDVVWHLLRCGVDVNATDRRGKTPLMHAVLYSRGHVARLLLAMGADVELTHYFALTPMNLAITLGDLDLTDRLREAGAETWESGGILVDAIAQAVYCHDRSGEEGHARILQALIEGL